MSISESPQVDTVIVGGSAAGLCAALALGRSRRSVVVIDAGAPRNAASPHMHGVLGHDGLPPADFLALGRRDLEPYDVTFVDGEATRAERTNDDRVTVSLADGRTFSGRTLVAATGLRDALPDIPGLRERWGIDVLHCPYCHGWEVQDQRIVVLATGTLAVHSALLFRQLSSDVTVLFHTDARPAAEDLAKLTARDIVTLEGPVAEVVSTDGALTGLQLCDGQVVLADAVVVVPTAQAWSPVLESLGLETVPHPMGADLGTMYPVEMGGRTAVPGVWASGNVTDPVGSVVKAVADGYSTGAMINMELVSQDVDTAAAVR